MSRLDESSYAENGCMDDGSAASWAMMHPSLKSSQTTEPAKPQKKYQCVGSLSPPAQPDMAAEAVMPPSQLTSSQGGQPVDYVLRIELRNFDGSLPAFPQEMLSVAHPLSDLDAHCRRERDNFKRQYLRAVKKFRRRRARIQHEQMLQQMQGVSFSSQQQQNRNPALQSKLGPAPTPMNRSATNTSAPLCDVSNNMAATKCTQTLLDTAFAKPKFTVSQPQPIGPPAGMSYTNTATSSMPTAETSNNSLSNAAGLGISNGSYLQNPAQQQQQAQHSQGLQLQGLQQAIAMSQHVQHIVSDYHSPLHTESLIHTIRAEIRLVARRSLVAQLRARRAKVKRAQFHAIVEEATDAVFVAWQKERDPLLRMSIRHYLQSRACNVHHEIGSHLVVMFDCPKP